MRFISVCWLIAASYLVAANRASIVYPDFPSNATPAAIAADGQGNLFVVANVTEQSGRPQIRVIKINPQGQTLASMDFGGSNADPNLRDSIAGIAVDTKGNVLVVGSTNSTDFPLVSPLIQNTADSAAFIVKIDSLLKTILFSIKLGGSRHTGASAMALDKAGNIFITGSTFDTDFPVTANAFQSKALVLPSSVLLNSAFLSEISQDGRSLLYSTYFAGTGSVCADGRNTCANTSSTAIAIDPSGNVVIGGSSTNTRQLPVTPGVFAPDCSTCSPFGAGFLAQFSPKSGQLLWATYVPSRVSRTVGYTTITALSTDSAGNIIVGGNGAALATSAGALQPNPPNADVAYLDGFLLRLNANAQEILFSTYFGLLTTGKLVGGIAVDGQDNIWITGQAAALPIPLGTQVLGAGYLCSVSPDGSRVLDFFSAPAGATGAAIALQGTQIATLGYSGSLLMVNPGSGPSLTGITNSATFLQANAIAPYELISLFGLGLGPLTAAIGTVTNGVLTNTLSGFQVLFDGMPGPLLYAGPTQINTIVPSGVLGKGKVGVRLVTPTGTIDGPTLLIQQSQPGVFVAPGPSALAPAALALNEDGSVNSSVNPAVMGSIVTVWATGIGTSGQPLADGVVTLSAGGTPLLPVSVLSFPLLITLPVGRVPPPPVSLDVAYAGNAPGLVAGVAQINFRLPTQVDSPSNVGFVLQVGEKYSNTFTLYMKGQ